MSRLNVKVVLLAANVVLVGCATVTTGTQQQFEVLVQGADSARCLIEKAGSSALNVTPGKPVTIPRSDLALNVSCHAHGYQSASITVEAHVQNRAKYELPFGMLVDYLSGARYEYPAQVSVTLPPIRVTADLN